MLQELKLEDLKHLRTEPPVPKQLIAGQLSAGGGGSVPAPQNGGSEDLRDLIEFSNISYQDVRQLMGRQWAHNLNIVQISVVDPDPNWILIQELRTSGSVFRIRIRIHTGKYRIIIGKMQKIEYIKSEFFFLLSFKIDNIILEPDPDLDLDLNSMYLDPQHWSKSSAS